MAEPPRTSSAPVAVTGLANAVAIPLVSFVVTPLSLAGAVLPTPIGTWLLRAAHGEVVMVNEHYGVRFTEAVASGETRR